MAGEKKKVLIVDHGSSYAKHLVSMYQGYPTISYQVEVVDSEKVKGKKLEGYDIIHLSGSRVKKDLHDEASNYVLENAGKDTYVIGTCYGAQVIAKKHDVDSQRLKDYQKGKQEIDYGGNKMPMHKAHKWGIPVEGSESKLEAIATSDQVFDDGKDGKVGKIHEVFVAKGNPRHIGIQGHAEAGLGKQVMYDILGKIHGGKGKGYKGR
ncbi:hypothetical protein KY366_07120 [Candidatus Woesearchaeota archaeon]|nr:hypothetical protein [Candidatus Woesearchaeota archaeon]